MFIRTRDTTKMFNETTKQISYDRHNRKGNIVKQFKLDDSGDIIFFHNDNVISKMIPKKDINILSDKTIKIIMVGGSILVYQEVPEVPIRFLMYNDNDEIITIDFDDIEPDQTSILCYDEILDDYFPNKVLAISTLKYEQVPDGEGERLDNKQYTGELKTLSNYITYSEYGIILNGILII